MKKTERNATAMHDGDFRASVEATELPENAFRELGQDEEYHPVMHPAHDYPEVTPYSVTMGLILAVVFSAAAAYLGLKVGQVFEAAIPIAIIAVGLSGALKKKNAIGQNVIIQSIGACSGVIVAGAIFTLPALYILQATYPEITVNFLEIFLSSLFGGVLGTVHRPVLSAGAAVCHHKVGEATFDVAGHGGVDQRIAVVEEREHFAVFFKKIHNALVKSGERFVAFVFSRVVYGTAIEYEAATISAGVVGYPFFICEAENFYCEALACYLVCELMHIDQAAQHAVEIGILRVAVVEELAEIGYGERHTLHEVGFLLEEPGACGTARNGAIVN